jgi:hypothetical protein
MTREEDRKQAIPITQPKMVAAALPTVWTIARKTAEPPLQIAYLLNTVDAYPIARNIVGCLPDGRPHNLFEPLFSKSIKKIYNENSTIFCRKVSNPATIFVYSSKSASFVVKYCRRPCCLFRTMQGAIKSLHHWHRSKRYFLRFVDDALFPIIVFTFHTLKKSFFHSHFVPIYG